MTDDVPAKLDQIDVKVDQAAEHRVVIAQDAEEHSDSALEAAVQHTADHIDEAVARAVAGAAKAAVRLRKETAVAASAVSDRLDRHEAALEKLEHAVTDVNKSVRGLLDSVLVLQKNSMRVLGAGALISGVAIFILSRALGL